MSEPDSLNWDIYPAFEDIRIDSGYTTIMGLRSDPIERLPELFEICKKEFPKSTFIQSDYAPEIIIKNSHVVATASVCYNCITVKVHESSQILKKILENFFVNDNVLDIEDEFFVEINHEESLVDFKKNNLSAKSKSGYGKYLDENELFTFLKFYSNKVHVADMLIGYQASEMDECTATILMFEVFSEYQRTGLGKDIMSETECLILKQGFSKLRLENTQSMEFWIKLGYDIDIDEGEKYLDPFECDDDD